MIVTRMATLSFPPALRVHTAAEAKVQGVAAATIIPGPNSPPAKGANGQTINGIAMTLRELANEGAIGRKNVLRRLENSSGHAIRNIVIETMDHFNDPDDASDLDC